MMLPLVALRRPVKVLVYLCPSTPVATPRPDAPVALQEGAWDAVQTDELGRRWWPPDDTIRVMYRHLDPALATWAFGRLRHDADPGPYPLEAPPSRPSVYIYATEYATEDESFTPESRRWSARQISGVEPIAIEGGHFPMLERPTELADLLEKVLDEGQRRQAH